MSKNLSRYNGLVEYKVKKNKATKLKISIIGVIFMILLFISFIATIIILNNINSDYENKENYTKEEFINIIKDKAIDNYSEYGVLPSITMAQAILESDYGNSKLASEYNNLFGIKANEEYDGEVVSFETKEDYDDVIVANFRAYNNFDESIEDHGKFLNENIRYSEKGFFNGKDYKEQAQVLEDAGYATVKDEDGNKIYAELLIEIIEDLELYIYDK